MNSYQGTVTNYHCSQLTQLLMLIIADKQLHARWLNSLSMMESIGARKIARFVDPIRVDEVTLQHAAEEARHALFLKRQIKKLGITDITVFNNYQTESLLAPKDSYRYLHRLDWLCSRYFKSLGHAGRPLKQRCYLYVTYLIEVRAMKLYHNYQNTLTQVKSSIHMRSIIKEEENHLANMMSLLAVTDSDWQEHCIILSDSEQQLFDNWLIQVSLCINRLK